MPEGAATGFTEAYILHARKYRDTSMICELLTESDGRVPLVMRGVRGKRSKVAGHIQPFGRMLVSWFGRGELKTARTMDFPFPDAGLAGNAVMLGLYVNELLVRLLGKYDAVPEVFNAYGLLLRDLGRPLVSRSALRRFELVLLRELGYGITFEWEADTGMAVEAGAYYHYVPDEGFHKVGESAPDPYSVPGAHLLAISRGDIEDGAVETSLRRIVRSSFSVLLGDKALKSRELFRKLGDPS